ncbi:NACHT domain-containing protein [Kibdelosporangium aridum]|uniref:NACHT domain-containing protein n=1 Tax=Kibdelosporangium aridum TaxID=2030 RepID=A0A428ZRR6_KIBAR|nr:NACHT domain-containing protein [Kibdelosporangium aridum]RSM90755.1 NACHT domain-containing protein [Kibdelosporangium aridum]
MALRGRQTDARVVRGSRLIGLEAAAVKVGQAVAQHAAREWLRRRRAAGERASSLAELAAAELSSPLSRGKLANALESIGLGAAEQLESFLAVEFRDLPDNEVAAAASAAVDALQATDLSDEALFAADADPEILARGIRRTVPRGAGLSAAGVVLYERLVDQGCRYLVSVVRQLPAFQPRALAEVLDRLSTVVAQVADILAHTPRTSLDAPRGTTHDDEFEAEYLRYLADRLDRLELLGLSMRNKPRLALSVAYFSLTVSDRRTREHGPDRLTEQWFGHAMERVQTSSVRVEAAIGATRRTLVRGDAGSGKTTLLDWIAVTAARRGFTGALEPWNRCVPFPIRLRRYVGVELPRPEHFLDHTASWLAGIMPDGWVHRCLRSGRALMLVDGVDEIPARQRGAVRSWLSELVATYPKVRVVVTARPAAAEERWLADEEFSAVMLEQMSAGDVRLFLNRWHEAAAGAEAVSGEPVELDEAQRRLLAQLDARPHLRELAANPLLCAMLCALNLVRTAELPRNRMELYRAAIAMLVDLRDAERQISGLLDVAEKTVLLRDLAWRLTLGNRTELHRTRALTHVTRKLPAMPNVDEDPKAVLDHLLERSGIIREPVPGRIDFVHRTFQEYLAASEATEEEHIDTLAGHAHLDAWRETIVMACGHAKRSQSRDLLTAILDRAEAEPRHARHLRLLAAACLETVTDLDPDVRKRIDRMITECLVPPRGIREARSLSAMGHRVLRYLPDALDGLSEAAAVATVRAAALTCNSEALSRLARYANDPRPAVQQELVHGWQYFDPARYADEILANPALHASSMVIQTRRLLPYVDRLPEQVRLEVNLPMHDEVTDLTFLTGLRPLTGFWAHGCTGVIDLGPISDHPTLETPAEDGAPIYPRIDAARTATPPISGSLPGKCPVKHRFPRTPHRPDQLGYRRDAGNFGF